MLKDGIVTTGNNGSSDALVSSPSDETMDSDQQFRRIAGGQLCEEDGAPATVQCQSPEDVIEILGMGRFQILMFMLCGLLWSSDAMETMLLSFLADGAQCEWDLTASSKALLSLIVFFGMLLGAPIAGYISDIFGRKRAFGVSLLIVFAFGMLSALAPLYPLLLVARFFVGFGIGGAHIAFGMCVEFLPRAYRGKLMIAFSVFWTAGSILEILLAWFMMPLVPTGGWRYLLAISSLPFLLLLLCYPFIPESPRFLYVSKSYGDLQQLFARVALCNRVPLPAVALTPFSEEADLDSSHKWQKVLQLFIPRLRPRTLLLLLIWFADAAIYYGVFLLVSELMRMRYDPAAPPAADGDGLICQPLWTNAAYASVLISAVGELPGLLVAIMLIDRIGRTWTQTAGFYITTMMALFLVIPSGQLSETLIFFVLRSAINSAFQTTFLHSSELYPTPLRSTALGLLAAVSRLGAMLAPMISQVLVLEYPTITLLLYAAFSALSGTLAIWLPETEGEHLSD